MWFLLCSLETLVVLCSQCLEPWINCGMFQDSNLKGKPLFDLNYFGYYNILLFMFMQLLPKIIAWEPDLVSRKSTYTCIIGQYVCSRLSKYPLKEDYAFGSTSFVNSYKEQ